MTVRRAPLTRAVEACLAAAGASWSRVADGEWGLVAQAAGWPLYVGLAPLGRFASSAAGAI